MLTLLFVLCCVQAPSVFAGIVHALREAPADGETEESDDDLDTARAAHDGARRLGVDTFTQPPDLCGNSGRLKLCFAAQLFRATPTAGLPSVGESAVRAPATVSSAEEWTDGNEPLVYAAQGSDKLGSTFSEVVGKPFSADLSEDGEAAAALPCGERVAFAAYVNNVLREDASVSHLVPMDVYSGELCERMSDGVLLCALLSADGVSVPSSTPSDSSAAELSREEKLSNVRAALRAGEEAGYALSAVDAEALVDGSEDAVLAAVWAVIHKQVVSPIRTEGHPELKALRRKHEDYDSWLSLPSEEVVRRWAGYHNGGAEVDFDQNAVRVFVCCFVAVKCWRTCLHS